MTRRSGGGDGGRLALAGVLGARRSHPSGHGRATRRGGRHGQRAREALPRDGPGDLEAPAGPRGRRARHPVARCAAPAGAPGSRGLRSDVHLDRALPPDRGGALPPTRRRAGRDARRRPHPDRAGLERSPRHAHEGSHPMTTTTSPETRIEADPKVPLVRIIREFDAPPSKVYRAHVEPELFAKWTGPNGVATSIDRWDARSGGSYRYVVLSHGVEQGFNGTFHELRPDRSEEHTS